MRTQQQRASILSAVILLSLSIAILLSLTSASPVTSGATTARAASSSSSSSSSPPVCRVSARVARSRLLPPKFRRPTILFWDDEGANNDMYNVWFGSASQSYLQCPVQCNIQTGRERKSFAKAEAIMFWATPLDKGLQLKEKCPNQLWLQTSTEAFDIPILDKTPPKGMMKDGVTPSPIDVEVSWRRYLGKDKVSWLNNYDWNLDFTRSFSAEASNPLSIATKTIQGRDPDQASVAAFISNCGAMSPRLQLLEELQKYIKVDSFGKCMHNKDVPPHWVAEADLSRGFLTQKNLILRNRYKFLLSFENQQVSDYVTEKFYHPLAVGVLPVVLGAPNIEEYAPNLPEFPRAFINIDSFAGNMSLLASELLRLDRDDSAYLRYFEWRDPQKNKEKKFSKLFRDAVQYSWRDSPCQVCMKVHEELYGYEPVSLLPEDYTQRRKIQLSKEEQMREDKEKRELLKGIRAKLAKERVEKRKEEAAQRAKEREEAGINRRTHVESSTGKEEL